MNLTKIDDVLQALFRTQLRQRKVSELGISHEEDFLQEEEVLRNSIGELEAELKSVRLLLETANVEKEKAEHNLAEVTHQMEQVVAQRKQLRLEVKELKLREAQTMADYSELEEENIVLQKQVLQLRQSQVEFEVLKQESRRLREQVEELSCEVESLNHLKEIVERNSQEMLELLHHEREQRSAMRRELDQRISSESMFALHTLASLGLGSVELNGSADDGSKMDFDDPDNPTIKKIEADYMASSSKAMPGEAGSGGDLFSEVHLSQITALEQVLEKLEEEKFGLEAALEESKNRLEVAQKEIKEQSEKVHQLKVELESSVKVVAGLVASHPHLEVLTKHYPTYEAAIQKILQLEEEVKTLHVRARELEHQVVKEDMRKNFEEKIQQLEVEVVDKKDFISEMGASLVTVQETLGKVSEELIQLYYMACDANCETPNKVMAEYMSVQKPNVELSPRREPSTGNADGDCGNHVEEKPVATYIACYKLAEVVAEQVKCTSRAVEHTVVLSRQRSQSNGSEEVGELQEQVTKLRAMLVTKREHVMTLRNVLRANKVTAEIAMTHLKQRYDHDKAIIGSNMARLRNELKVLKEDATMFASLRVMFAQRCDEYATTIEQLQRQLSVAENERKTMNRLLHMAIQQKLALSARVAELENGRDPRLQRQLRFMRGRGGTLIYSSLPRSEDASSGRPSSSQGNRSK